jgi:hypothetical protein
VNSSGELHANVDSDIEFIGQLSVEDGRLSGSGTWERFHGENGSWKSK